MPTEPHQMVSYSTMWLQLGRSWTGNACTCMLRTKNLVLWVRVSRVFHCKSECSGIATKPWTLRYSMVALERSLHSSRQSQPKYCKIDDGTSPDDSPCCSSSRCRLLVSWSTLAFHWRSGRSPLNCFNTVNVTVSVRGPDWRSMLQFKSYSCMQMLWLSLDNFLWFDGPGWCLLFLQIWLTCSLQLSSESMITRKYFADSMLQVAVMDRVWWLYDISGSPRHTQDFTFAWIEIHLPSSRTSRPFL